MSRRLSAAELQERADLAKAREAARRTRRAESTATPSRAEDTVPVWYYDPINKGDVIYKINVPESNLFVLGGSTSDASQGITRAGVASSAPSGSDPIEITKGSKISIVRMQWYKGDSTVSRQRTPWNSVWFRRYDTQTINGRTRSHFTVPFSVASATVELNEVIDRFQSLFTGQNSLKDSLLGDIGEARLTLGYGNQQTILSRVK